MEAVTKYRTHDGAEFDSREEAEQHETELQFGRDVNAFLDSDACPYKTGSQRSIAANAIIAFTKWQAGETAEGVDGITAGKQ